MAVGAGVNGDLQAVPGLFGGVLHVRAERQDGAGLHEDGDLGNRVFAGVFLAALEAFAGLEIIPGGAGGEVGRERRGGRAGERGLPVGQDRLRDRMDQDGGSEQIFVAEGEGLAVLREVHHQRAHDQPVFQDGRAGEGIDVRHQLVAELDGVELFVEGPFARRAEAVDLRRERSGGMVPHHRHEDAPLHPAHLQFLQGDIVRTALIEPVEEAADVGVPVRDAADRVVQAGRNLRAEHVPAGLDVAAPAERGVALDAEGGAARHLHGALRIALRPVVIVDAHVRDQRERVPDTPPRAVGGPVVIVLLGGIEVVRLGGIAPEGVHALVHQAFQVFPVDLPGLGVERVVDLHAARHRPGLEGQEGADGLEFLELRGQRAEVRPDGDREVRVVVMDIGDHRIAPFVQRVVEAHRVPVLVLAPVLPVLDDAVQRNAHLPMRPERLAQFLGAVVPLPALPVAMDPEREHRRLAAELVLGCQQRVHVTAVIQEIQVRTVPHLAGHRGLSTDDVLEVAHAGIVPIHAVTLFRAEEGNVDMHVLVPEMDLLAPQAQVRILPLAQAVQELVGLRLPALAHLEAPGIRIVVRTRLEGRSGLLQQLSAAHGVGEGDLARGLVDERDDLSGVQDDGPLVLHPLDPGLLRLQHHGIALFLRGAHPAERVLHHPHHIGRIDGHLTDKLVGFHGLADHLRPHARRQQQERGEQEQALFHIGKR